MALHPSFPSSPYEVLDPAVRWFPAAEEMRETAYEKLLPPRVAKVRQEVQAWRASGYMGASDTSKALLQWWFDSHKGDRHFRKRYDDTSSGKCRLKNVGNENMTPLTDEELLALIHDLESDRAERKQAWAGNAPEKGRQAVCAFANDLPNYGLPGVLFVGVKDHAETIAIPITDRPAQAWNALRHRVAMRIVALCRLT